MTPLHAQRAGREEVPGQAALANGVQVWLATGHTDMRKGVDRGRATPECAPASAF